MPTQKIIHPVKILEISGNNWASGLSAYAFISVDGLFQKATNFDPFRVPGLYEPTGNPTDRSLGVVKNPIQFFVGTSESGASYSYGFANSNTVYKIDLVGKSVSTVVSNTFGIDVIKGALNYKQKLLWANSTTVLAGSIPLAAGPTQLLTGLASADHIMCIGPDRNAYVTNGNSVARITSVTGLANNSPTYLTFEADVTVRDLKSDGKYLVILGDQNPGVTGISTTFRSFVAFWNMKSQDLTQIWEFEDRQAIALEVIDDIVVVFGNDNIYTCAIDTPLVPIWPLLGNASFTDSSASPFTMPTSPRTIIKKDKGVVLFGGGTKIMGYGREMPQQKRVFFEAYNVSTQTIAGMYYDGFSIWSGTNGNVLFENNRNATGATSTLKIAGIDFKRPYEFSFAKVILRQGLASGQSVDIEILTDEGTNTVMRNTANTANSFSFGNFPNKKSHIFYPYPGAVAGSSIGIFEDLSDITIRNIGASVRRVEIWGKPFREVDQTIYK